MLADVIRDLHYTQEKIRQLEIEKYNKPYKRDTIIYCGDIHIIGGIETWIQNLSKKYEFSVVYDTGDEERLDEFNKLGIETIKYVGQKIECNTLIRMVYGDAKIKSKKTYLFIHGIYDEPVEIPEHDKIYAVSKVSAKAFEKVSGEKVEVMYNPIDIEPTDKPLVIGVFSRLTKEKGKWRIQYLIEKLKDSNRPFLMLIFTDYPFEEEDDRVIFIPPVMNPIGWMEKCDWILNPSDTEAGSITLQEALKLGKPLIVTKLPILDEFGINESNAKILEFDMSNLDVNDLWNIPKVKWSEPVSKEWEDIMKKKVFREKYQVEEVKEEVKAEVKEKPKKKKEK